MYKTVGNIIALCSPLSLVVASGRENDQDPVVVGILQI